MAGQANGSDHLAVTAGWVHLAVTAGWVHLAVTAGWVHLAVTAGRYVPEMDGGEAQSLLLGLTEAQEAAVTEQSGLLCLEAGAGSGKTMVLTRRIAFRASSGALDPAHVLAVTFTRKAGAELRSRLRRLGIEGVWAGTFHSAAYAQLRRHWADHDIRPPALVPDPTRLLRRLVGDDGATGEDVAAALATEIGWARARALGPDDYGHAVAVAGRETGLSVDTVADLYEQYRLLKRRRGVIDMDDLVEQCSEMLEQGGASASGVRWRFRHLLVDEFQDMNPAQWRLLEAWRAGRPELFVVGDGRQAVYSWNGSDPQLLSNITELVPGMVRMRLDQNHRSTPQIVRAAAAVLRAPFLSDDDGWSSGISESWDEDNDGNGYGDESDGEPMPYCSPSQVDGPVPVVVGFDQDTEEAAAMARWLRRVQRPGTPWSDMAVLARTNARLEPVASALRVAGIPVRLGSTGAARHRSRHLQAVTKALRRMDRRAPLRSSLVDVEAELSAVDPAGSAQSGYGEDDVLEASGAVVVESSSSPVSAVTALADEHAADEPDPTVGSFLAWLAANPGALELLDDETDAVDLVTFHRAKGLEWQAVAVVGLEEGLVPIAYARSRSALAEERRLLYVAVTRAERELWCSWSARPSGEQRSRIRGPSPMLAALSAASAGEQAPRGEDAAAHIARLRSRLAAS